MEDTFNHNVGSFLSLADIVELVDNGMEEMKPMLLAQINSRPDEAWDLISSNPRIVYYMHQNGAIGDDDVSLLMDTALMEANPALATVICIDIHNDTDYLTQQADKLHYSVNPSYSVKLSEVDLIVYDFNAWEPLFMYEERTGLPRVNFHNSFDQILEAMNVVSCTSFVPYAADILAKQMNLVSPIDVDTVSLNLRDKSYIKSIIDGTGPQQIVDIYRYSRYINRNVNRLYDAVTQTVTIAV